MTVSRRILLSSVAIGAVGLLVLPQLGFASSVQVGQPAPAFSGTDTNGKAVSLADLKRTLSSSPELSLVKHGEKLGPVEAAGEDRILIGDLRESGAGGFWLWAAMDNLTTGRAVHALRLSATLLGSGPVS